MKQKGRPLISIIIVNYNGRKWLQRCLSSLFDQTYTKFEIIFVDNNSTDDSVVFVKKNFPKVTVIETERNLGFAGGNNEGYKMAKGEYVLLINNDTLVERDYIQNLLSAFDEIPNLGIVQSKLELTNGRGLDTCGGYWTDTSFLYYIGNFKDPKVAVYNNPFPVFTCKGASVLIKKEVLVKIGLFDDAFWNYYEETDLCHRAWIAGYECWYYPKAICYHEMGGTSLTFKNELIQFHNFKNKLCSYIKNLDGFSLLKTLPLFFILNIAISIVWILQGKYKHALSLYKSIWWNLMNISSTLTKRNTIQKIRKVSDSDIWAKVKRNPKPMYYKYLFNDDLGNYQDSI